ncbi:glycosyltransferase family 2 protein [Limosilactobacillus balticus]|uniref:glycosyltransferase family 2 protein n=1 Tax=Limosilactobacillus balticus TaxID=2759747 RepID=UPI001E567BAA|nr:glycosyltransferase family 2 protein [Limosilactobacillus balticus]MCD7133417.1 glycosyltransferase family 2 protein [Limosilactobacillus balticus]
MSSKVSIIVPIYNVDAYLKNALTSLQQQTYRDIKVIMINDGSTDHSDEVAQEFLHDPRFMLVSQKNQGLSAARNTGLKYVDSEYVYFFDSDDQIAPNLIETVLTVFNKSKVDLVSFKSELVSHQVKALVPFELADVDIIERKELLLRLLSKRVMATAWSYITRTKVLLDNDILFPVGRKFEDENTAAKIFSFVKKAAVLTGKNGPYFYLQDRSGSIMTEAHNDVRLSQLDDRRYIFKDEFLFLKKQNDLPLDYLNNWYFNKLLTTYNMYRNLLINDNNRSYFKTYKKEITAFQRKNHIKPTMQMRKRLLKLKYPILTKIRNYL